jgi:hypothetical protein
MRTPRTGKQTGNVVSAQMGVQVHLYQDSSNNMRQLQGAITLETNFMYFYVLSHIFLFSNILCILCIDVCNCIEIKILNKSKVLTSIGTINPLTPELNPCTQRCLRRFFYWGF